METETRQSTAEQELRRGPWTVEEDLILTDHISKHGEGRWNSLAQCAGLKRTGKSCRLRWLNYLRPDVRRGNITAEEQLLILELHSRWGNRWSKIARHLPGRTDNEIKNYWRTRVQKHANQPWMPPPAADCCNGCLDEGAEAWAGGEEGWSEFLAPAGEVSMSGFLELGEIMPNLNLK